MKTNLWFCIPTKRHSEVSPHYSHYKLSLCGSSSQHRAHISAQQVQVSANELKDMLY